MSEGQVLVDETELKSLKLIAYLVSCKMESENENNMGDTADWNRHLENEIRKYEELGFFR